MAKGSLRRELGHELTEQLLARGWARAGRGNVPPMSRSLQDDLVATITPLVDGHRYGGASLAGMVEIRSDAVSRFFASSVPAAAAWSALPLDESDDARPLDLAQFGQFIGDGKTLDYQWHVPDESSISPTVAEFMGVVTGPVEQWLTERKTPEHLIAAQLAGSPDMSAFTGRHCAVFALQHNLPADAASLVKWMASNRRLRADDRSRLSVFQDTLTENFPQYQPVPIESTA